MDRRVDLSVVTTLSIEIFRCNVFLSTLADDTQYLNLIIFLKHAMLLQELLKVDVGQLHAPTFHAWTPPARVGLYQT